MTSQKSLKNKVYTKDFLRSLGGSVLFPAIALIVLLFAFAVPTIAYIADPEHQTALANTVSLFLNESSMFYYDVNLLQIGMVLCGMLTAIKQYYFSMSKKQVNVYFSLGISRMRLFINRAVAAIISLFVSVFIPAFFVYIVNIAYFGASAHLTGVFLYVTLMFFISALAGFAVGAFAVTLAGNVFEAGLTCATASLFGILIPDIFSEMCSTLLNGFVYSSLNNRWTGLLSPFKFVMDLDAKRDPYYGYDTVDTYRNPIGSLMSLLKRDVSPDKYKVPEELVIDKGFILPLFFMFIISAAVFALAVVLFKKRKAENANSLGHFRISSFINSAFIFAVVAYLLNGVFYSDDSGAKFILGAVLITVVPLLAYFIIQLILTRKIKAALRSLAYGAVLSAVTVLTVVMLQTDVFGTYNKTPDKASLECVAISVTEQEAFWNNIDFYDPENIFYSNNSADIDMVLTAFDSIKNNKHTSDDNMVGDISVAFKYKNGKVKYRSFLIYSDEIYENYLKDVYDSDYFDEILKDVILGKSKETDNNGYYYGPDVVQHFRDLTWYYFDSDLLDSGDSDENIVAMTDELLNALYSDLSEMTFEQFFKNNSRPLGLLAYNLAMPLNADEIIKKVSEYEYYYDYDEGEGYNGNMLGESAVFIYPEMKRTIACLKDLGYEADSGNHTVKEILYTDSNIQISAAARKYAEAHKEDYSGWGDWDNYVYGYAARLFDYSDDYYSKSYGWNSLQDMQYYITKDTDMLTIIKDIYIASGHPLTSVTEQSKIDSMLKGCVPFYRTVGDEGRYAYAIYDDGSILAYYIPQANLAVLK